MATILDYRLDLEWLLMANFVVGALWRLMSRLVVRAAVMMMPGSTVIWYLSASTVTSADVRA